MNRLGKTYGWKTDFKVGACDLEPTAKDAGEVSMKGLMISAFAAVALLAAVAIMHLSMFLGRHFSRIRCHAVVAGAPHRGGRG